MNCNIKTSYNCNYQSNINTYTYFGPTLRSTDDKVRRYGLLIAAGVFTAGVVALSMPLSFSLGAGLAITGTLLAICSLFKITYTKECIPCAIQGSGNVIKKHINLNLDLVKNLTIDTSHKVIFQQGNTASLEVMGEDNILNEFTETLDKSGHTLLLSHKPNTYCTTRPVIYTLTLPVIHELNLPGTGTFQAKNLDLKHLKCNLSGTGIISLSGKVSEQNVHLSGTGSYDAAQLQSDKAVIKISGTGAATVNARSSIHATITGTGSLIYHGNPQERNIECSGVGSVQCDA